MSDLSSQLTGLKPFRESLFNEWCDGLHNKCAFTGLRLINGVEDRRFRPHI